MTSAVKTPKSTRPHPTINSEQIRDAARQTARDDLNRLVDIVGAIAERIERLSSDVEPGGAQLDSDGVSREVTA